jgi:MFS family permease
MEEQTAYCTMILTKSKNKVETAMAIDGNSYCTDSYEITIDHAIDNISVGKFQYLLLFAAGTCFMADAMEIMLLSFLTLVLKDEWKWDDNDGSVDRKLATITAFMFVGAMVGTMVFGPLGDRIGRRPVLFCATSVISFFGMMTALCSGFWTLLLVRFMVGFGIGGLTVPFDILIEFIPTESRGKFLLLIEYYWTLGSMMVPVIAYFTIEVCHSWQLFVVFCAVPSFISLMAGVFFVPESPRWLVLKGRNEEALDILREAAIMNGQDSNAIFPPGCIIVCEKVQESKWTDLFQPQLKKITLLLFVLWSGFAMCYYGAIMIIARIFEAEHSQGDYGDDSNLQSSFDYSAIFISSSAEAMGTAIAMCLVDRIGRIPTIAGSYFAGGIVLFLLCFFLDQLGRSIAVTLSFMSRVFEMIASCTVWISTAEIFTTEIRSTGHSATNAVARIGGFISPYLVSGNASFQLIGSVFFAVHIGAAFCALQLPETKGVELGSRNGKESISFSRLESSITPTISCEMI